MALHNSRWFLQNKVGSDNALIGFTMFSTSFLPWFKDPFKGTSTAWNVSIDPGWIDHGIILNYGTLCLVSAIGIFLLTWASTKSPASYWFSTNQTRLIRCFCMAPVLLFLWQYLFLHVSGMATLTHDERELLFIQQQLGYQVPAHLIALNPMTLHTSTFIGRLQLFLDQISFGPPILCSIVCLGGIYKQTSIYHPPYTRSWWERKPAAYIFSVACASILIVIFLPAPSAMVCEYAAKEMLSSGNYVQALKMLDRARFLNPELEQVAYYHKERGQAEYFLFPNQQTEDSLIYLASMYQTQGNYVDAYQQLFIVWQVHPTISWVVDEMSTTLESLAKSTQQRVSTQQTSNAALVTLHMLLKVDPTNPYGFYTTGRIQYAQHNYTACITNMISTLRLSSEDAIQSSAYTYIALSEANQGNYATSRALLFKAISLDPAYYNTTAREQLSGLH